MEGKCALEALKTAQLRNLCKDLQVRTGGNKQDLQMRLQAFLTSREGRILAYLRLNKSDLQSIFKDIDPYMTLGTIYKPVSTAADSMIAPPSALKQMESSYKHELRCICIAGTLPGIPCSLCSRIQHIRCMAANAQMQPYVCPLCQLMKVDLCSMPLLPPLVNPFAVSRANPNITRKNMDRLIRISAEIAKELEENHGTTRVEVRCLRLDGRGAFNTWPSHAKVKVNTEEVLCIPDTVYFKVQKGPLDISDYLHAGDNVLHFWRYEDPEYFAVAVFLVRVISSNQLLEQIVAGSEVLSFDAGLQNVLKSISSDEELRQESTPVSVKCPISLHYIKTAVRGSACTHVQCYDLETFLVIFGKNAQCPECGKAVTSFVIDDFITQLSKQAEEKGTYTVYIHKNGHFTFLLADERSELDASDVEEGEVAFVRAVKKEEMIEPDAIEVEPSAIDIDFSPLQKRPRLLYPIDLID